MKVLLDENLPHDLRFHLPGHEVFTVSFMKWQGLGNGELLSQASVEGFECLITKDAGVAYEQNLQSLPMPVVILRSKTNKLEDIRPLVPQLLLALDSLLPKSLVHVG